jgi:hypothetical protein
MANSLPIHNVDSGSSDVHDAHGEEDVLHVEAYHAVVCHAVAYHAQDFRQEVLCPVLSVFLVFPDDSAVAGFQVSLDDLGSFPPQ